MVVGAAVAALVYDPLALAAGPKTVTLILVAVTALGLGLASRGPIRAPSRSVWLWLLACAWSALTLAWGNPAALAGLAGWLGAAGLMLQVGQLDVPARVEVARLAAAWIGSVSALAALVQRLVGAQGIAVHGGQGNPNWLGLVLAVALPLTVDAALAAAGARRRLLLGGCVVQLGGLLLSGSRVGWIALALVALVAAVGRRRRRWGVALVATAGLAATLWIAGRGEKPLVEAWAGRVQIWTATARAASVSQPFGVGLGDFGEAYLAQQGRVLSVLTPGQAARRFINATTAHGDWLQVSTLGLADRIPPSGWVRWTDGARLLVAGVGEE